MNRNPKGNGLPKEEFLRKVQKGRKGGKDSIDWNEGFRYYCEKDENNRPHNLIEVSLYLHCATNSVERACSKFEWVKNRDELYKAQTEEYKQSKIELIQEAEAKHLRMWRKVSGYTAALLTRYENAKEGGKLTEVKKLALLVASLQKAIAGERVILGLPNDVTKATVTNFNKNLDVDQREIDEMDALLSAQTTDPLNLEAPPLGETDATPQP